MKEPARGYTLRELQPLGAAIHGLDLKQPISDELKAQLERDVYRYHVLVVKDQGVLTEQQQVTVSEWFGELHIGVHHHEKCSHEAITRMSNDASEGYQRLGSEGFHIDANYKEIPIAFSIYHSICLPRAQSQTLFVSLNAVYMGLSRNQKRRWLRLSVVRNIQFVIPGISDTHPLVYDHPVTGKQVMCFNLGKIRHFIWDACTDDERVTGKAETRELIAEIEGQIRRDNNALVYAHQWEDGDFIISDNLSVCHLATESTQAPREEIGLRVMHRTMVNGTTPPTRWKHETRPPACTIQ